MEMNQKRDNVIEVDLREVIGLFIRNIFAVILSGMIFAMAAILVMILFVTPEYQSVTKMYVLSKQNPENLTSGDMQTSTLLTQDYVELIKTRDVTEAVIDELDLDISHKELIAKMDVVALDNTRIIKISVRDEDPYLARAIADTIREQAAIHIQKVMSIEAVNVAEKADIPEKKYSPNITRNGLIAGVLGCAFYMAVLLIRYIGNDTIKTSDDIERYLQLSTLGVIPADKKMKKKKRNKGV